MVTNVIIPVSEPSCPGARRNLDFEVLTKQKFTMDLLMALLAPAQILHQLFNPKMNVMFSFFVLAKLGGMSLHYQYFSRQ